MKKSAQTRKLPVLVVLASLAMPTAQASTRLVTGPKCEEPVPTRSYEGRAMTYGLSIDLSACWWWNGSPIQLVASLSRLDGTGEEGTTTGTVCGGWPESSHDTDGDGGGKRADKSPDKEADGPADEPDDAADNGRGGRHDEEGDDFQASSASESRFTCEVSTALEHPSAEVALYRGEITYPWKDGEKTVGFSAYCASPGGFCRDGQ